MPHILLLISWVVLMAAVFGGYVVYFLWRKKRREGKFPFPENLRLMRFPGECLRRELQRLEEKMMEACAAVAVGPLVVLGLLLLLPPLFPHLWQPGLLIALGALSLLGLGLLIVRMVRLTEAYRDRKLGMFGERVIADQLDPLKAQGFAVFHDVPCLGGGGRFNLDHVIVGRGAIAVIETKTRRKKPGPHSATDFEVSYDGNVITWPGWKGRSEITQVIRNKDWLARRLKEKLNLEAPIHPFIAIPGWKVNAGHGRAVSVQNHRGICGAVLNICKGSLTPAQEDLIARHLRDLCQDVTYADA